MNKYPVYRTPKGTLTLQKTDEPVLVIKAKTLESAKETLEILRKTEKQNNENV